MSAKHTKKSVNRRALHGDKHARSAPSACHTPCSDSGKNQGVVQEALEVLLEHTPDSVVISDTTGRIVRTNPAFLSLTGYGRDEISGVAMDDIVVSGAGTCARLDGNTVQPDQQHIDDIRIADSQCEGPDHVSKRPVALVCKDRGTLNMELTVVPFRGRGFGSDGVLWMFRDITEKAALQDALQKNEERFQTFFEYAPDAIYISDDSGTFIDGNRIAEQLTGYSREELIGKNYFDLDLLTPEQFPRALELLERNIAGNPTGPDEFVLRHRDGSALTVEICTYPLYIHGERCVLGVAHDISERKRAEEELKKTHDKLERRVRERTQDLEDSNTALRVLLKGRDEDRSALEESVLHNLQELILPCLEKLRTGRLPERQRALLDLLEINLRDITAPMLRSLSMKHLRFTPMELSVATCIRQGKKTGEIAGLLGLSIKTVQFHRENIRRKCGIQNKKVHLKTFLSSLA